MYSARNQREDTQPDRRICAELGVGAAALRLRQSDPSLRKCGVVAATVRRLRVSADSFRGTD